MTVLVQGFRRIGVDMTPNQQALKWLGPVVFAVVLIGLAPKLSELILAAMSEAYLAVSVFVAGTLALIYAAERGFNTDLGLWLMKYRRWQPLAGALLGALPGCGGAIVAMTQYTRGYLSFGGVVATLTATMGDAMFLLLAREPLTGLGVLVMGMIVGTVSGYIVDAIHAPGFMLAGHPPKTISMSNQKHHQPHQWTNLDRIWVGLMVPGLVIGLMSAFQVDVDGLLSRYMHIEFGYWLGVAGAALAAMIWFMSRGSEERAVCNLAEGCNDQPSILRRVMDDTNFITVWVILAFVGYELVSQGLGVNLEGALSTWAPLVPAMAILLGFIPGCGPQILVTSLYVSGAAPLSAQLGNAISNDGDALFPALAVAPKAALLATVYSAVPAVVVAYGWYLLFE